MKSLIITLSFLLSASLVAQETSTLSIKGVASVSVKPTVTIVSMNLQSTEDSYSASIEHLIDRVDQLTASMKQIGFKDDEIITSNFNINKRFNYNQGRRDEAVFDATQTLRVQIRQSKKRLLEVLNTATASTSNPEIMISFDIDDEKKKAIKEQLIKLAIKDAKQKAQLIAKEAGYQLSNIKNISYGESPRVRDPLMFSAARSDMQLEEVVISNMEVSNLSFSESVDIVYIISEN